MRACALTALLVLQCLRHVAACSGHSEGAHVAAAASDDQSPLRWGDLQQRRQRRRLRQAGSAAAVMVKYLKRRECGSQQPSNATQQSVQRRIEPHVARIETMAANQRLAAAAITIDVHFHVLRAVAGDPDQGDVPRSAIQQQISVLNKAYASTGFQFRLASLDRTSNVAWFNADVDDNDGKHVMNKVRSALHRGSVAALNVYSLNLQNDLLGEANYPFSIDDLLQDSVVVHFSALPGQGYYGYNLGMTLTHETGHWLGLYHVFQGGCSDPNDRVSDTGMMAGPNYNCVPYNKKLSTCSASKRKADPSDPGYDPSFNFLGYAPDACMNQFTQGQAVRMRASWDAYRKVGQPKTSAPAPTAAKKPTKKVAKKTPKRKAGR